MVRILFWLVLGAVVYAVIKSWARAASSGMRTGSKPAEQIVRCAACGLNVPESEAHARGGLWYCSREHLEQARPGA